MGKVNNHIDVLIVLLHHNHIKCIKSENARGWGHNYYNAKILIRLKVIKRRRVL